MLGKDGPRTYLLLFDNNAEIRATGGLPGAFSVLRTDHGKLSVTRQGVPADIGRFDKPVLPQSEAEQALYHEQIAEYPQDTNFTPEFPRTAELLREMWKRSQGQKLDGVLSVDAVSLSYVLRATGAVRAPGGVTLTPKNATAELINRVYSRLPSDEAQNEFFQQVAQLVFDKVVGGVRSPPALVSALGQSAREGRLYVHDFDPAVQRVLAGSTVAGEIHGADPRVPEVGVYLNDATGSKMSYYLRTKVSLKAESCSGETQQLAGVADLTYTKQSPPVNELNTFITGPGTFGTPRGEQLVLVRLYGPRGGELSDLRVAGRPTSSDAIEDRGRPVATVVVQLRRGQTVRVSWRVRTGDHQDRPARLTVTPGMSPTPAVKRTDSTCEGLMGSARTRTTRTQGTGSPVSAVALDLAMKIGVLITQPRSGPPTPHRRRRMLRTGPEQVRAKDGRSRSTNRHRATRWGRRRLPTRLTSQCSCSNQLVLQQPVAPHERLGATVPGPARNDLHGESVTPGLIRTPSSRWRRLYATTTDLVSRLTDRPIRPSSILTETSWYRQSLQVTSLKLSPSALPPCLPAPLEDCSDDRPDQFCRHDCRRHGPSRPTPEVGKRRGFPLSAVFALIANPARRRGGNRARSRYRVSVRREGGV